MLKVGLTGGVACGKSTVSAMFRELGARIIDADVLAREALEPGRPAYKDTVCIFGKRILGSDGRIDRKALAGIVFGDPAKRSMLEAVVHPRVFEEEERIYDEMAVSDPHRLIIFDAALICETGADKRLDRLVVVWCRPETQLKRLIGKSGMSKEDAILRLQAQMPIDEKRKHATHVVDNDGGMEDTRAQVERIYRELAQYV